MSLNTLLSDYRQRSEERVVAVARAVAGRAPSLDARLREVGLDGPPTDLAGLDRMAVLSKDDLPRLTAERPFGGLLTEGSVAVRAFASPGPIYEAQPPGPDPWRWRRALEACGIGPGDVVLNCFSYHLSPAGAMFDEGCQALGATVVPAGVGMQEVQVRAIADLGVTAYVGMPTYLSSLVETYDAAGLPRDRWRLEKALVTAEPLPPELRASLRERVPTVLMAYGTAEAGLIGHETAPDAGLHLDDGVFVEICEPGTGEPVEAGKPGEVVVSVLHEDFPLLRFGTGDVSRWTQVDGVLGLAGVLGRVGAAVKVRGMFVHPHQAAEVLAALGTDGAAGGRFVVEHADGADVLYLDLVAAADADRDGLAEAAARRCRDALRIRPRVRFVDATEEGAVLEDRRR